MPRLWDMIDEPTMKRLLEYQFDTYGGFPKDSIVITDQLIGKPVSITADMIESLQEIDKLMKQPPKQPGKRRDDE